MAKYTTTIKTLLDHNFDFGLKNYPLFDETYRETLNNNILFHYYENEIGFETAGLFKFYLNQKMNEIMPYYNELYKAQQELINNGLFSNVNLNETLTRNTNTNTTSKSNSISNGISKSKNVFQDTPQGKLKEQNIENYDYASNITLDKNDTSNSINDEAIGNSKGNETYLKTIIGNNGGKYNIEILEQIKNNLINIDLLIINELQELFMQLY